MKQLTASRQLFDGAVVIRFEGEVDMAVADEFRSHLKAGLDAASPTPGGSLIIDLEAIAFFASTGLNALVACHDEGASNGIPVRLVTHDSPVVQIIKATHLDEILPIYPTVDDALGPCGGLKGECRQGP